LGTLLSMVEHNFQCLDPFHFIYVFVYMICANSNNFKLYKNYNKIFSNFYVKLIHIFFLLLNKKKFSARQRSLRRNRNFFFSRPISTRFCKILTEIVFFIVFFLFNISFLVSNNMHHMEAVRDFMSHVTFCLKVSLTNKFLCLFYFTLFLKLSNVNGICLKGIKVKSI
jgi:magnesium-transporting ATPase (P-type)